MEYDRKVYRERAFLSGHVVDRASGLPVAGAMVSIHHDSGCLAVRETDASGRFKQMNLPAGEWRLVLKAPSRTWNPPTVTARPIALDPKERKDICLEFNLADFLDPPLRATPLEGPGTFRWGFEMSEFVPDDPIQCGLRNTNAPIWVEFGERFQSGECSFEFNHAYRVRWKGTLEGPGKYGHLGVGHYRFVVDQVLESERLADTPTTRVALDLTPLFRSLPNAGGRSSKRQDESKPG
jgi:hypothetical protein